MADNDKQKVIVTWQSPQQIRVLDVGEEVVTLTCCPHIRDDPEKKWILAADRGLMIQLNSEESEQLLLCSACAAIVEGHVLKAVLSRIECETKAVSQWTETKRDSQ